MDNLQHSRPLFLGVLFSALVPALMIYLILMTSAEKIIIPVLPAFLITLFVSLTASVVVGLPFALWLRSRGWLTAIPICSAGLIFGAIVMASLNYQANYWPQMNDNSLAVWIAWSSAKKGAIFGAILGVISAAAFCFGAGIRIRSP